MGQVLSPASANFGDGVTQSQALIGKQGEALAADIHGQFYNAAVRGKVGKYHGASVTMATVASGLVAISGSLHNPAGSGVIAEIIQTEIGSTTATTVVNTIGWYFSTAALSLLATFTTPAVAGTNLFSARTGETPGLSCVAYSAATHSGTPVRCDQVITFGAVTNGGTTPALVKNHNGTLLVPPGILMSLATSTAASTTTSAGFVWAEWPYSAAA